jgi:galactoside O-acetyltransferase
MQFKRIGKHVNISDLARFYNPKEISIGDNVRIDDFCVLSGGKGIDIGDHTHIAVGTNLYGGGGIKLGRLSGISTGVNIWSQSDDFTGKGLYSPQVPAKYKPTLKEKLIEFEDIVLIGTGVTILPGVTIGMGVSVGAHSLITHDLEPWYLYAGNPIRKIMKKDKNFMLDLFNQFLEEYDRGGEHI